MQPFNLKLAPKAIFILLVSGIEFLCLRLFVRNVLHLRFGWPGFTDYDIAIPGAVAFFIFLSVLDQGIPLQISLQRKALRIHGSLLLSFLVLNLFYLPLSIAFAKGVLILWGLLGIATFFSSFFLFVPWQFFLRNDQRWAVFPSVLIAFSCVIYHHAHSALWPLFVEHTGNTVCGILYTAYPGEMLSCISDPVKGFTIYHRRFSALVAPGCSGLDGQLLLSLALGIWGTQSPRLFTWSKWLLVAAGGAVLIYLVNILRLVSIFVVGVSFFQTRWHGLGKQTVLTLFHSHIGWIFYLLALCLYFRLMKKAFATSVLETSDSFSTDALPLGPKQVTS